MHSAGAAAYAAAITLSKGAHMTTETTGPLAGMNWATKAEREDGHVHAEGQKCDACGEAPVAWMPYGGATSFTDADRFLQAQEIEMAAGMQVAMFESLERNIWQSDLDARQKAQAIGRLASELDERISTATADPTTSPERQGQAEYRGVTTEATSEDPGAAFVMRDKAGKYRWLTIHSNKYRDREGDIFSEQAHKNYVAWATEHKAFPGLRLWHAPLDIGQGDFVGYDDNGFVLASGTFKAGFEDIAERLAQMKDLGCSHGYLYRPTDYQDGVYNAYRSYEVSVLPRARAANTLTSTAFFAGEEMPVLGDQQKQWLTSVLGEDKVKELEEGTAQLGAAAASRGLSYKAIEETLFAAKDEPPSAVAEPPAATAPPPAEGTPPANEGVPAATEAAVVEPAADAAATQGSLADSTIEEPREQPAAIVTPPETAVVPPALPAEPPQPTAEEQAAAAASIAAAEPLLAESEATKAMRGVLSDVISPLLAQVKSLEEQVVSLKGEREEDRAVIEQLAQGSDAHLADMVRPRIGYAPGFRAASASAANVVDEAEAQRIKEMTEPSKQPATGTGIVQGYLDDAIGRVAASVGVTRE